MNNKALKIGVIGAGGIARSVHMPSLAMISNIEIAAICDIEISKAETLAKKYNIPKTYTLYREMLAHEKLDAVFVLVQPDQLFRVAADCLNAGTDVMMEKPAGLSVFQARHLERIANENNRILQVAFNRRFIPLVRHVLKILEGERINQVNAYFVKHGKEIAFYDGVETSFMLDVIHSIDVMRWIAGGTVVKSATVEAKDDVGFAYAWNSVMAFDNGVTGTIQSNYCTGGRVHGLSIFTDNISAYINTGFGEAACSADIIYGAGKGSFSISSAGAGDLRIEHIDGIALAGSEDYHVYYGYLQEDIAFIESVRTREVPVSHISDAIKSMELAEKLLESRI